MADAAYHSDYALEVARGAGRQWQWTVLHRGAPAARGDADDESAARRHGLFCAATLSALKRAAGRRP